MPYIARVPSAPPPRSCSHAHFGSPSTGTCPAERVPHVRGWDLRTPRAVRRCLTAWSTPGRAAVAVPGRQRGRRQTRCANPKWVASGMLLRCVSLRRKRRQGIVRRSPTARELLRPPHFTELRVPRRAVALLRIAATRSHAQTAGRRRKDAPRRPGALMPRPRAGLSRAARARAARLSSSRQPLLREVAPRGSAACAARRCRPPATPSQWSLASAASDTPPSTASVFRT